VKRLGRGDDARTMDHTLRNSVSVLCLAEAGMEAEARRESDGRKYERRDDMLGRLVANMERLRKVFSWVVVSMSVSVGLERVVREWEDVGRLSVRRPLPLKVDFSGGDVSDKVW
jgi:hypothetical protein